MGTTASHDTNDSGLNKLFNLIGTIFTGGLIFTFLFAVAAAPIYFLFNSDAFVKGAGEMFMLTPADLKMIPVGVIFFFVFWRLIDKVLFAPYLKLIEAREAATEGAESTAVEVNQKVDQIQSEIEAEVREARVEAMRERMEAISSCKQKSQDRVTASSEEAQKELEGARREQQDTTAKLRDALSEEVDELADMMVAKITAQGSA